LRCRAQGMESAAPSAPSPRQGALWISLVTSCVALRDKRGASLPVATALVRSPQSEHLTFYVTADLPSAGQRPQPAAATRGRSQAMLVSALVSPPCCPVAGAVKRCRADSSQRKMDCISAGENPPPGIFLRILDRG
jgi:hypothetical protein